MALKFKDGFDYLTGANNNLKWDNASNSGLVTPGVYGKGKALLLPTQAKTLPSNYAEGFEGFHYFYGTVAAATICRFLDAGTIQCDFRTDGTGAIFATRNGTPIGTTSTFRMVANTVYWIQAHAKIDASAGVAELSINGTIVCNSGVTNLNTKQTGNSFFNQVGIGPTTTGSWYDSFHAWDTAGGDNFSTYITECLIDTKLPNGAGSNAAWTPNSGTNFSRVNEANEDGDTSYNASGTPNQIDSFAFANLDEASGAILDVAVNTIDRDDDATPRTFEHFVKSGSATALSAAFSPPASYINHQSFNPTDPNTSTAWTVTTRNAAEFGYKEIT